MPSFVDHPDMPGALAVQRPDGSLSPPLAPQMAMQADPAGYAAYKAGTGGAASMGAQAGGTPAGVTDLVGPEGEALRIAPSAGPSMAAPEAYSPAQAAAAAADPFGAPKNFNEPIKTPQDIEVENRIAAINAREQAQAQADYEKTKANPPLVMRTDLVGPVNAPAGTPGAVVGKADGGGTFAPAATGGGPATGNAGAIGLSQYEQDVQAQRQFNNALIEAELKKRGGAGRVVDERDQKTGFSIQGERGPDPEAWAKKWEGEMGMRPLVPEKPPALELKPKDILEVWAPPKVEAGKDKFGAAVYREMKPKEREQWAAQWAQRAKDEGLNAATLNRMLDPNLNAAKGRQTGEEIDAFRRAKLDAWDNDLAKRTAERDARVETTMAARRAEEERMGGPFGLATKEMQEREVERNASEFAADRMAQASFTEEQGTNAQAALFNRQRDALADIDARIKTVSERATAEVDPKRYWKDKSAGEKVLLVLAGMFGGAGAGLAKQPNLAAAAIERSVNDDIDAQKTNIANAKGNLNQLQGLYQDVVQRYGSEQAGLASMKVARLGAIESQIKANMATATSEKARIQAEKVLAIITQKRRDAEVDLSRAMNGQIATQFKTIPKHIEGGGGGPDPKRIAALLAQNREISGGLAKDSSGIAKDAAAAAKSGGGYFTVGGQKIAFAPGMGDADQTAARKSAYFYDLTEQRLANLKASTQRLGAQWLHSKEGEVAVRGVLSGNSQANNEGVTRNDDIEFGMKNLRGLNSEEAINYLDNELRQSGTTLGKHYGAGVITPDGNIRPFGASAPKAPAK